jgi:hypothetical protein
VAQERMFRKSVALVDYDPTMKEFEDYGLDRRCEVPVVRVAIFILA